jgi:hypothetical protein
MRQLSVAAGVPKEGSATVRRVDATARRVLQGREANWHPDIVAKVGAAAGVGGSQLGGRRGAVAVHGRWTDLSPLRHGCSEGLAF